MRKVNLYFKNCVGQMEGDELCYTYLYLQVEGRGEGGIYWPQLPRQGYSLCLDSL
jgi:hypothetical protein